MFNKMMALIMTFISLFTGAIGWAEEAFYETDDSFRAKLLYREYLEHAGKAFEFLDYGTDFVPQGICYSEALNQVIVAGYRTNGTASRLYVYDSDSGKYVKKVSLLNEDGTVYSGHAGGVAAFEQNLWVVSGSYARRLKAEDIRQAPDGGSVRFTDRFNSGTRASYISCANGILWVGEYYKKGNTYVTDDTHHLTAPGGTKQYAWTCGYRLESGNEQGFTYNGTSKKVVTPDYILSTEDMCQGFTQTGGGKFITSISGGYFASELNAYENVLKNVPDTYVALNGQSVPLWFLDSGVRTKSLRALPKSEGLQYMADINTVYVVFESGTKNMWGTSFAATKYVWKVDAGIF